MNRFFNDGDVVLFQGDSVTDCGRDRDIPAATAGIFDETSAKALGDGYPRLVKCAYDVLFPNNNVTFVNRAVSGDRTDHLLERYEKDFLDVKPTFISILIGVNDTWRNFDRTNDWYTSAEVFGQRYEQLLKQIKRDLPGVPIMLIEQWAFTTWEGRTDWSEDILAKVEYTKQLGEKYADYYIPMFDIMTKQSPRAKEVLSKDGVHPASAGHQLIANEFLKTLGII